MRPAIVGERQAERREWQIANLLSNWRGKEDLGFGLCFLYLRNVRRIAGTISAQVSHLPRTGVEFRIKPRKRLKQTNPMLHCAGCAKPGLVHGFHGGSFGRRSRRFRLLNVPDDFDREGLDIEVDFSQPAVRVIRSLNQIIEWRGKPFSIRVDHGPEYVRGRLME